MELLLSFSERIILSSICSKEDTYINLIIREGLIEKLKLQFEEINETDFKSDGKQYFWDEKREVKKTVEITKIEQEYLAVKLKQLNKEEKLNYKLTKVYSKII